MLPVFNQCVVSIILAPCSHSACHVGVGNHCDTAEDMLAL